MNTQKILQCLRAHFGSYTDVAKQLGCTKACVTNWKVRGIPASKLGVIYALSQRNQLDLEITDFWPELKEAQKSTR